MKSLEDHIKDFIIPIGKYKDLPLIECDDLNWLDWYAKSDFSNRWQKKLVNYYIGDIAADLYTEEDNQAQIDYDVLKSGAWVDDDNF